MFNTITRDSVKYSLNKLETFVRVNKELDVDDKIDALALYALSLGVDNEALSEIVSTCKEKFDTDLTAHVIVGVLLGLGMVEYVSEQT